jgi:hypothetical protein
MSMKMIFAGLLCLIVLCTGCSMCCHPYDYNGPVYDSNGQCLSNVRAGSILENGGFQNSGYVADEEAADDVVDENSQPTPAPRTE